MRKALETVFTQINNAADKFDELDAAVGDGDMGRGISRGMVAGLALLPTLSFSEQSKEAFSALGSAIADAHAGSSGPMVGALVAVGGSQLVSDSAKEYFSSSEKGIQSFLQAIVAGVDAIQQIGGAQEGDRTLVDVLSPLRTAIKSGEISGAKFNNDRKQVLDALIKLAKEKAISAAADPLTIFGLGGMPEGESDLLPSELAAFAALREAKEETCLDVDLKALLYVYSNPSRDPRVHTMSTVFVATSTGTPIASDDAKDVGTFALDALPENLCFDHAEILADYKHWRATGERPTPGDKLARYTESAE